MSLPETKPGLRVLVIEAAGNLWGSERVLLDLLAHRQSTEYAVCCPPATPIIPELQQLGVRLLPFFIANLHQKSKWQRVHAVAGVLRACRCFRPQVVYLNQSGCYRIAALACRLLNLPIVAHVRIVEDAAYLAECRPNPARLKAVIAISHWIADEIQKETLLAKIPVQMLYDGYSPVALSPLDSVCRPPLGLRPIACVGRVPGQPPTSPERCSTVDRSFPSGTFGPRHLRGMGNGSRADRFSRFGRGSGNHQSFGGWNAIWPPNCKRIGNGDRKRADSNRRRKGHTYYTRPKLDGSALLTGAIRRANACGIAWCNQELKMLDCSMQGLPFD